MFNTLLSRAPRTRSTWRVRLQQSGVVATALAVMLALSPGAFSAASAVTPAYVPPGTGVQFTLEGCRNNGGIALPIMIDGQQRYACLDPAYTTGNLGKGWNELDLVPHRMIVQNSSDATTFNVIIAADNETAGKTGYDAITDPAIFRNSTTGCSVSAGPVSYQTGVTGGADKVIYRELTITAPAKSTCMIEWANRLALGSHLYSGSSLQSYMFERADFSTGKKTISIPVREILPQELSKTMAASRGSSNVWAVTKEPSPARVTVANTCTAEQDPTEAAVSIKVEWTKSAASPDGAVTILTTVSATNPASRTVTVDVTDKIYASSTQTTLIDEKTSGPIDVAANSTVTVLSFTSTWNGAPADATTVNDVATATYTDKVTGLPVPGTTTATKTATIQTNTSANGTAVITDVESLTGPAGAQFSVAEPAMGAFDGYTAGAKTTGPVTWKSGTVSDSGSVTFTKTLYIPKGTIGSGELKDTATLVDGAGNTTSASAHTDVVVDTLATLSIAKTIPNILTGSETAAFTFDVKDSQGAVVADDVPVTFAAGETSKTVKVSDLAPDTYTVVENPVPAGWDAAGAEKTVDLTGAKCAGTASFSNTITEAKASAVKVTDPAGQQAGWKMTLTRTDTDPDQTQTVTTDADGKSAFGTLAEGTYTITEESRTGWDAGTPTGDCTFTVDYPASAGKTFTCTFTNTERGRIIVKKTTDPASDTTTEFSFDSSWSATDFTLKNGGSENSGLLTPGEYSVSENVPAGWKLTDATCDDGSTVDKIALSAGETVTCTFTNTQQATITVEKVTDPASTAKFTFTPGGWNSDTPFELSDGESLSSGYLMPGSGYSVAESVPTGWDLSSVTCSGGQDPAAIILAAGQNVTCTFTNTQRGKILVKKVTDPASDTATGFTFDPSWSTDNFVLKNGETYDSGLLVPGEYNVFEQVPAGWDLKDATCSDGSKFFAIQLDPGETVTCTFTNVQRGQILVKKLTDPASDTTTKFTFDPSWGENFVLTNGQSQSSGALVPGEYHVSENALAGWDLTGATCDDGSPITAIDLGPGETVTCTFTNVQRGEILVKKVTDPASDTTTEFTFNPSWGENFVLTNGQSQSSGTLVPGEYNVSENALAGWDLTSATCDDASPITAIDLGPGETVTCTFTNVQRGTLIVRKVSDPAGSATFDFTPAGWNGNAVFSLGNGEQKVSEALVPGQYSVTEEFAAGWDLSKISCDAGEPVVVGSKVTVTVPPGQTVTCTYNNTQRGQIIVKKVTDPATDTVTEFGFTPSWAPDFSLKNGQTNESALLQPATYSVSEKALEGWDLTGAVCSDGSLVSAIDLGPGETVTCTFTNTQRAELVVEKVTKPASAQQFSFTPTGWNDAKDFTLANGGSKTSELLVPGAYSVTEAVPTGWDLTGLTCSAGDPSINGSTATVTLLAGQKVTCTYTNTERGKLVVQKVTRPASDEMFAFTPTGWNGDEGFSLANGQSKASELLVPGDYSVAETVPSGWDLTELSCDTEGAAFKDNTATVTIKPGQTVTCTYTNVQRGRILVKKVTSPASDTATEFTFDPSWTQDFTLKNGGTHDSGLLVPGDYTVAETAIPGGWDLTGATCDDGSKVDAITLAAGETVTCTFTNVQRGQIIVEKVTDPATDTTSTFGFDPSWSTTDFTLKNGGSHNSGLLVPGRYAVTEDIPFGWTLDDVTCTGGDANTAISLEAGETVTCTFTNVKQTADLRLVKQVNGGGSAKAADWLLSAVAGAPFDGKNVTDVAGDVGTYAPVYVDVAYDLSESAGPANYTPGSEWVCVSDLAEDPDPAVRQDGDTVTLDPGDKVTCVIVNTRDTAELKLVKAVEGGTSVPDDWTLSAAAAAPENDKNFSNLGSQGTFETVYSNTAYTLAETGPGDYTASDWVCTDAADNPVAVVNGTVTVGKSGQVTCQITNTRDTAELKLVKTVAGDNGAKSPDDWTLTADAAAPLNDKNLSTKGGSGTFETVYSAVDYTLAETGPGNYTASTWVCTDAEQQPVAVTDGKVTVGKSAQVTCQITNTRDLAELKLVKQVEGDNQAATADDWTLSATAQTPLDDKNFSNLGGSGTFETVYSAVDYTLAETGPGDYTASTWVCTDAEQQPVAVTDGKVTVGKGAQVTCVITNTRDTAELKLVKAVEGGTSVPDDWTLSATAQTPLNDKNISNKGGSGTFNTVYSAVDYTLAETGPGDYTASDWVCTDAEQQPVSASGSTVKLGKGDQVTCILTNSRDLAELKLVKTVQGDNNAHSPDDWTLSAGAAAPLEFYNFENKGGSGTFETVYSNTAYTLAETGPGDYTPGDWVCTNAADNPVAVVNGTVTVGKSAQVTCQITNTRDTAELKLVKQVSGGSATADDWTLTAAADTPLNDKNMSNKGGSGQFETVYSGIDYTLAETGPANYTGSTWSCVAEGAVQPAMVADGDTVRLDKGDRVTCTIVNTRDLASLKLVKQVSGGKAAADEFTLTANADAQEKQDLNISTAGGSGQFQDVYAGTQYALTETGPGGYTADVWQCVSTPVEGPAGTELLNSGDSITLDKGDRVTCTIVNTRDLGSLTIVKEFNAQTSGFTGTFDINYACVDGADPVTSGTVSIGNGQSQTITGLPTGTVCTVTEPLLPTPPAGWSFNDPTFVPASGQATVTAKDQTVSVRVVNSISQVSPVIVKRPCPVEPTVVAKISKKGNRVLVKKVTTKKTSCQLQKPVVLCKPMTASAAGETAFCKTRVTKAGRIAVKTRGYAKVRVTAIVRSKPKPGWADEWKPSTWRKSWILR